jgi:hypothetical protein
MPQRVRFLGDRVLRLALRADEEDVPPSAATRARTPRPPGTACRLAEVDDVDAVPFAEDERLHLRVPALRLVPEVNAGLQQVFHRDPGQAASTSSIGTGARPR